MGDPFLRAYVALQTRALEERGQTASEYMGILLVVAVIVAGALKSGIVDGIGSGISDIVKAISHGKSP
jgi:Flp pilus assembly pilin Flp